MLQKQKAYEAFLRKKNRRDIQVPLRLFRFLRYLFFRRVYEKFLLCVFFVPGVCSFSLRRL